MSEAASWYYVGSFGQLGPLTKDQLDELIEGGVVEKSTYLWKPGMQDWLPAGSVADFTTSFLRQEPFQSPPPIPTSMPTTNSAPMMAPPPTFGNYSNAPAAQGQYPRMPVHLVKSDKSRTVSGILQIIFPGIGRIYLGYAALGVIQLVLAFVTCGMLHIWSIIDGILLLSGQVRIDGYGRALED
jgi:TM2 domain-containing membrane protein YozV